MHRVRCAMVMLIAWCTPTYFLLGGDITGTVKDPKGKLLEGIFVSARNVSLKVATTVVTDQNGRYSLLSLIPGDYVIEAKQIGFVAQSQKTRVQQQRSRPIDFVLKSTQKIGPLPSSSTLFRLPDGEQKRYLAVACMGCHQFNDSITEKDGKNLSREQWSQSIEKMLAMFGPSTGFPIIPPLKNVEEEPALWFYRHLWDVKGGYDERMIPPRIRGEAAKVVYTEYDMPKEYDLPHDLVVQRDGKVLVTGMFTHTMLELDPTTGKFLEYPIPERAAGPRALEIEEDGTWWVLLGNPRKIGRFNPRDSVWKTFDIKEYPHSIGRDSKGNLWFNAHFSKDPELIGKLNPANGELKWFEVPSAGMTADQGGPIPYELRVGADGTVWGGELVGNRIFKFNPTTEQFKVFPMPTTHSGPRRFDIAPDGVLWIPEYGGNNLTKFDPKTEKFKQYPYPTSSALPYVVRVNKQTGMVWLATAGSDEVARFDPKTEQFVMYRLPTQVAMIRHMDIDPKTGAVWVAYASVPPVHPKVASIEVVGSESKRDDTLFIDVGNKLLQYSRIKARTDTLELFITRNDTLTPVSTLVKTVRRATEGGEEIWIIAQQYTSPRAVNIDTSFIRAKDLMPLRYCAQVGDEVQRCTFTPSEISGEVISPKAERRTIAEKLSHPVFNAVADHELITSLPLRDGLTASYMVYNPPRGFGKVQLHVSGKKAVMTASGKESAWVVEYAAGGAPTTMWISAKDGSILALRSELRGGSIFWRIPRKEKDILLQQLDGLGK